MRTPVAGRGAGDLLLETQLAPLRIALLTLHYPPSVGGTSTHARSLANGLTARGHDVVVIVREGEVEFPGAPFRVIRENSLRLLLKHAAWADIVHMNGFWLAGALAARLTRTPLVWTHHEYDTRCPIGLAWYGGEMPTFAAVQCGRCMAERGLGRQIPKRFAMLPARRLIATWSSANVSPSRHMGRSLGLAHTEILHYGLPPRTPVHATDERLPRFVFAGRLTPEKGCDVLVRAAAECYGRGVDFVVDVYGDGPEREALEREACALQVDFVLRFHGSRAQHEVVHAIAGARATIVPSLWQENSPLIAIESMAAAVPIIAARSGGLPETIGAGGLVVDQGSATLLAGAITALASDPAYASRLGVEARKRFERYHSLDAVAKEHEKLYRRVGGETVR